MKKNILIKFIIFSLIIFSIYLFIGTAKNNISLKNIHQINIYNQENKFPEKSLSANDDFSNILINIVNNSFKKKNSYTKESNLLKYNIFNLDFIYKNNENKKIYLYFNLQEKIILSSNDNINFFKLNNSDSKTLFLNPIFESIYINKIPPKVNFKINDAKINYFDKNIQWSYKKVDGLWHKNIDIKNIAEEQMEVLPLNPSDILSINYTNKPSNSLMKIYQNETLVYENEIDESYFIPLDYAGDFTYIIESNWDYPDYKGKYEISFNCSIKIAPQFYISKSESILGDFFFIKAKFINDNEKIILSQNINKTNPNFQKIDRVWVSIFPINFWSKTGNQEIYAWTEKDGEITSEKNKMNIFIKNREFKKQFLTVEKSLNNSTRNDNSYAQYNKYFPTSRVISSTEKLWEGLFIKPVEGKITTDYGEMRYVNNEITSYRHTGIDIAAKQGSNVLASNSGKVVLAMNLIVSGNTIVIDHGLNLFTVYKHLDSMNISIDDFVKKGQYIGTVGSTGFSTGPHLHFATSINNTSLNPLLIIGKDPLENLDLLSN